MKDRRQLIVWTSVAGMALLLFGNAGFRSLLRLTLEQRSLQRTLAPLHRDHDELSQELNRIQTDPSYTEFLIRKSIGYVRKGEIEYRLMTPPAGTKSPSTNP